MTTAALVTTPFLCSLTVGFLFALAVVLMPGLKTLEDAAYLRTFQLIDEVIQKNQPLFMLMWVGSIVGMLAALGVGVWTLTGGGGCSCGVRAPCTWAGSSSQPLPSIPH